MITFLTTYDASPQDMLTSSSQNLENLVKLNNSNIPLESVTQVCRAGLCLQAPAVWGLVVM